MVRGKVVKKLVARWAASFLSVVILLSMVAAPVVATVTANSVGSSDIIDGSIRTRDIKRNAINSSRIRNYSIRKEDIHSGSINKYKLTSNAVNTYKIEDGSVRNQDIAHSAVDSAKIADGSITNADIAGGAAISDSKISYDTAKTGHLSIPPSAFIPENQNNTYSHNSGNYLYSTATGAKYFFAPVYLPDAAKITKATFEIFDANSSYRLAGVLARRNTSGSSTSIYIMASASTSNPFSIPQWQQLADTSISYDVVDNSNYSYFVQLFFYGNTANVRAGRVLIEYTYTIPGR